MLSFFIVGCKEEDEDKTSTTVAEDKANIQASFNRTKNLLESFKNGSFYKFVDDFIDYQSTAIEEDYYTYYESSFSEFTKMLVERLGEIVDKDEVFANDKFNFANLAGKYEWNMS
ncbi:MAG: hypothetical protein LBB53_05450, partial [Prevotellaceae bacterium]|nr:hypothetical protein [Prevotellaceae bacterium]